MSWILSELQVIVELTKIIVISWIILNDAKIIAGHNDLQAPHEDLRDTNS